MRTCVVVLLVGVLAVLALCVAAKDTKVCTELSSCKDCADRDDCAWRRSGHTGGSCIDYLPIVGNFTAFQPSNGTGAADFLDCEEGLCVRFANLSALDASEICHKDGCVCEDYCTDKWFPCTDSLVADLILIGLYGLILAIGAYLISEGSEGLLEVVNSPGFIGGFVIPVLGAVPDAAMVVASGIQGDRAAAQENIRVGLGTLAGSTIMLLTIPWALSLLVARTNIVHGESVDRVLTVPWWNPRGLLTTGTSVDNETRLNALVMIATLTGFAIVQIPAFAFIGNADSSTAREYERWFALGAAIYCGALFIAYSLYQMVVPSLQKKRLNNVQQRLRVQRGVDLFMKRQEQALAAASQRAAARAATKKLERHKERYERRGADEERKPLVNIQGDEEAPEGSVGGDGEVTMADAHLRLILLRWKRNAKASAVASGRYVPGSDESEEEEDSGEEEGSGGLFSFISPKILEKLIVLAKSMFLLAIGTGIVTLFSDPMVPVLTDFGRRTKIPAFFVSFVVTPFCSNASELISSLLFASKKRKENSALTYSAIYGAATMNNTMVLGIFFLLIFIRELAWEFTSETIVIVFATVCVGIIGILKRTFSIYWAGIVILFYPISLGIVAALDYGLGLK